MVNLRISWTEKSPLQFVTTTTHKRLHLFNCIETLQILVDSLSFLIDNGRLSLYAFVLMPNHVHLVAAGRDPYSISDVMRDFKSFTAHRIIMRFKENRDAGKLRALQKPPNRKGGQIYCLWERGFNAKDIYSAAFLLQKVEYIHNNPCQPAWNLEEKPEDYPWSSAAFYLGEEVCALPVMDCRSLIVE